MSTNSETVDNVLITNVVVAQKIIIDKETSNVSLIEIFNKAEFHNEANAGFGILIILRRLDSDLNSRKIINLEINLSRNDGNENKHILQEIEFPDGQDTYNLRINIFTLLKVDVDFKITIKINNSEVLSNEQIARFNYIPNREI